MSVADLHAHLATGNTTVCQCWVITRKDGVTLGFTDHDMDLAFDGIHFAADSGMSAKALASSTGLSVDNTEAIGLIQSAVIEDADIAAGRYDDAEVTIWQVRWDDVSARQIKFAGHIGEITRKAGTFQAELRGQADALNQPQGRSFLRTCSAVLGDAVCGVDLSDPAFVGSGAVTDLLENGVIVVDISGYAEGWFDGGRISVTQGIAAGLMGAVKTALIVDGALRVTLWADLPVSLSVGDIVTLVAGCDRRADSCRQKFANILNFQGFPDIPGDDWLMSVPRSDGQNTGGSLTR